MAVMRPLLALVMALVATSAVAQDRAAGLAALLDRVPASVVLGGERVAEVIYGDVGAAAAFAAAWPPETGNVDPGLLGPMIALSGDLADSLGRGADRWPELLGIPVTAVAQTLVVSSAPRTVTLMALTQDPDRALSTALIAQGYQAGMIADQPVLFRGQDDFAFDMDRRDIDFPFGGSLGRSSRVWQDGALIVESRGRDDLAAVIGGGASLMDRPDVAALLDALDDPALGQGALVRAELFMDPLQLLPRFTPSFDMSEADLQSLLDRVGSYAGPNWGVGLLADLAGPDGAAAVLVLAFGSTAQARTVADGLIDRWGNVPSGQNDGTYADIAGQTPTVILPATSPPTVIVRLAGPPRTDAPWPRNRNYDLLLTSLLMADMVFLPPP